MSVVVDAPEVKPEAPAPVVMLPDECPRSGKIRNFKVECAAFGAYKRGSILPKHVLLRSAGAGAVGREDAILEGMLTSRRFSQTYEPVNVQLAEPKVAKTQDQVGVSLTRDANEARAKLAKLEQDHVAVCADRDGWKAQVKSRDAALGEQASQIANLQAEIAARDELMTATQAEVTSLTRRVEELTGQLEAAKKASKGAK